MYIKLGSPPTNTTTENNCNNETINLINYFYGDLPLIKRV